MKSLAVICRDIERPLTIEEIQVDPPGPGEVMIRMVACGVCHSDLSAATGVINFPPPLILGHEGAGIVMEVGAGVTHYSPGDTVLTSFVAMCGVCHYCTTGRPALCEVGAKTLYTLPHGHLRTRDKAGNPLNVFSGLGAMAEYATVSEMSLIHVPLDTPLKTAAIVSCGVMTGFCAVTNAAQVRPGSRVVVFGCGGVGLSAIQGALVSGAAQIVAVDIDDGKLNIATTMGATNVVNSKNKPNIVSVLRKLTQGGADYCFECVGSGQIAEQAYGALRKGGHAVIVGVAKADEKTSVHTSSLTFDQKTLSGSYFGGAQPRVDANRILHLYRTGKIKLDEMVTHTYAIREANQAFADLRNGRNARGVIVF